MINKIWRVALAMTLLGSPVSVVVNSDGSATVTYSNGIKQRLPKAEALKLKLREESKNG